MSGIEFQALTVRGIGPLDLAVAPGECVCLSGPSGAGKSLILRAIADLDPHAGDMLLDARRCTDMTGPMWRRRVGLMPAESQWWADTVGEHFSDDRRYIEPLGFDAEVMDWRVSRLSTGEKQRLALARMLGNSPSVLLLDEPTASLDRDNTARVEALLDRYRREHDAAVLWVSHDPEQIARVCQRHLRIKPDGLLEAQ